MRRGGLGGLPFLGRGAELAVLTGVVAQISRATAGIVFIEGEPGIGKTRLVDELLAAVEEDEISVMRATAREVERNRPFGVVMDALGVETASSDAERAAIAGLVLADGGDGEKSVDPKAGPNVRYQVVEAILRLTERLALNGPILLALEDLHWADPSSLLTLDTLTRRLRDVPVGVIATFRPGGSPDRELDRVVEGLVAGPADHVVLGPLDDDMVACLAAAIAGAPPGQRLSDELRRAEGNPLFVIELLRALSDDDLLVVSPEEAEVERFSLPPSLRLMLLRRFSHVSRGTLDVLRVASVLGSGFEVPRLALVTRRSATELTPNLQESIRAGILCEAGTGLAFRHDLIREAMYGDLPEALRAGLHLDAAWALAEAGATPVEVSEHLALGAQRGDRRAIEWLHNAARDILALAPASAAELLERALSLGPAPGRVEDALRRDLVVAKMWCGHLREAEELARSILRRPHDPEVGMAVRVVLIDVLGMQGRAADVIRESEMAVGEHRFPGALRAQLRALAATGLLYSDDVSAATAPAECARREAEEAGDADAVCVALAVLGLTALVRGYAGEAVRSLREAVVRAERSTSKAILRSTYSPYLMLGLALGWNDQLKEAVRTFQEGLHLAEALGAAGNLPLFHWGLAAFHFMAGSWDEAITEAETGFVLGDEVGAAMGSGMAHAAVALIALHRNELGPAQAQLACAEAVFHDAPPEFVGNWLNWGQAMVREAEGDRSGALAVLDAGWGKRLGCGLLVDHPLVAPDYVRLACAGGSLARAEQLVDEVDEAARRLDTPTARGAALRCRGMLERDAGMLMGAVGVLRHGARPLDLGRACEEASTLMPPQTGADLLQEAAGIYEGLGAARDLARVDARLRSMGVRRGRRGPRQPRATTGWESLTKTERDVVGLVGQGLTNAEVAHRLFISPRTVECHLSHAFRKLDVASRAALRSEVVRRQAAPVAPDS